ncbi:MAG TPA: phosphatidate cytidylyltransferase [Candidatus Avacidaminococcus intestinavium]|uniref:Phosphatidate cytidylyltransferase n=1 Tax=Candidatus Avacidaminococcus intestinavium TaxID=2840684 RepID=A0A9D1MQC2_9FIRM|nr:phosphatidate cytidylyltransferase [Candidatus Avacidaminococcus intestinavium]
MLTRTITAVLGFAVALWVIQAGGVVFALTILLLSMLALGELYRMLKVKNILIFTFIPIVTTVIAISGAMVNLPQLLGLVVVLGFITVFLHALFHNHELNGDWFKSAAATIFVIVYVSILFPHFIFLRELPGSEITLNTLTFTHGEGFIWLVLLGTWASDTFAYLFGCAFGKRPLCPSVSPKKSIEGAAAGFCGCLLVMVYLGVNVMQLPLLATIGLGMLVAFSAPLGDLAESLLKRYSGVKDSGKILPGHGGVLDRFDSLLFAVPLAYYYIEYFFIRG